MKISLLFRITGVLLFVQLALGGLVTLFSVDPISHIAIGVALFVSAVATMAMAFRLKPRPRQLVGLSAGIVADIVVQALLGFAILGTASNTYESSVLAWVHFINALAIYGMTLAGTFMAMGVERAGPQVSPSIG